MENDERISRIQSFGYNIPEASFLCAAALHGGFFLRRQYAAFTGKVAGYADVALGLRRSREFTRVCSREVDHPPGDGPIV